MNDKVQQRGKIPRYKIRMYSFKKFAFTTMADAWGEIASRAIKGDREYVFTYYKKSREERAEDYKKVMPRLCVFEADEKLKLRHEIETALKTMNQEELAKVQVLLKSATVRP